MYIPRSSLRVNLWLNCPISSASVLPGAELPSSGSDSKLYGISNTLEVNTIQILCHVHVVDISDNLAQKSRFLRRCLHWICYNYVLPLKCVLI